MTNERDPRAPRPTVRCAIAMATLAAAIGMSACRDAGPTTEAAAASRVEVESPHAQGGVRLTPAQLEQVEIEALSTTAAANAIKATGTVEFNADRTAKLLPPVAGQVQDLAVNVGDTVRKNQVLFVLSSREAAAGVADHIASRKDLELAEKTFAMTKDLFEHDAASRIALEQSQSELAKARSKVMQAEESLRVLGLDPPADDDAPRVQPRVPVRTPIDGTVIDRTVTAGQFVGPDTSSPLLSIADLSSVWVQGEIFERDLRYVSIGEKADVTTAAYPTDRFSAQVSRIASVIDPQTRTAKVRFLVANPGMRLKPGMFASISLYVPAAASSLSLPARAVFAENGKTFAYVQTGPLEFERRGIETAPLGSDRLRVLRGLHGDEHVISDGVLLLRQLDADVPSK